MNDPYSEGLYLLFGGAGLFVIVMTSYYILQVLIEINAAKDVKDTDPCAINPTLKDIRKQLVTLTNDADELSRKIKYLESLGNF